MSSEHGDAISQAPDHEEDPKSPTSKHQDADQGVMNDSGHHSTPQTPYSGSPTNSRGPPVVAGEQNSSPAESSTDAETGTEKTPERRESVSQQGDIPKGNYSTDTEHQESDSAGNENMKDNENDKDKLEDGELAESPEVNTGKEAAKQKNREYLFGKFKCLCCGTTWNSKRVKVIHNMQLVVPEVCKFCYSLNVPHHLSPVRSKKPKQLKGKHENYAQPRTVRAAKHSGKRLRKRKTKVDILQAKIERLQKQFP